MTKIKKILIVSSDKSLRDVLNFCFEGWGYETHHIDYIVNDITPVKKISPDIIIIDVHSATKTHLDMCRLLKEDFITASIPIITLINKRQLRSELLTIKQGVDDYLIKPPDPLDLRIRVEMALRRSQYSSFASPLTGLPGGRTIEEVLKEKLKGKEPFSFGYMDIDHFKYFNDVYGYLKGDRVIMQTAYVLYTTIRRFGNKEDFMGHIGGDDFVFITTPDKYKDISHNLIVEFERVMPFHYTEKDRAQGYVVAMDRSRKMKHIPLMSISIAVATRDDVSTYKNIIEINEKVAEIKRYLKTFPGSKFMEDRRNRNGVGHAMPQMYKKEEAPPLTYKPLGQLLADRHILSNEKLDEALCVHWRRGLQFGEVLKELGFIKEAELEEILRLSHNSFMHEL